MSNAWYEIVGPEVGITQGDIVRDCPLLMWKAEGIDRSETKSSGSELIKAAIAVKADVIVMTQACDLEQQKVADVVLCPCVVLSEFRRRWAKAEEARRQNPTDKAWGKFCNEVKDGFVWNLFLAVNLVNSELPCEHWIVDFHHIHTVPRIFLDWLLTERASRRLRLQPPYREHLSQAFARYFMQVGLPTPVTKAW